MKAWVLYTVVRLGIFAAALAILVVLGTGWILGTVFASLIALALSLLFLGDLRERAAASLRSRAPKPRRDIDAKVEDDRLDRSAT